LQFQFGCEFPFREIVRWTRLVAFLSRFAIGFVDCGCGAFDKGTDAASSDFFTQSKGERVAAKSVDIFGLRETGFSAAIDYEVELFAVGTVEYS
jgi:hypothetical protein